MRTTTLTYVCALGIGLLVASCSSKDSRDGIRSAQVNRGKAQTASVMRTPSRSPLTSFASMPDRGELLAYDKVLPVKHRGAYTAYPVGLSEAHALNASVAGGELTLTAPDGKPVHLKYERHVEHADGNWTWIGRDANGAEALLTFGEKAVFGSVPNGERDTLRLTMSGGRAYLVSTDRSKLAGLGGEPGGSISDQLIPQASAANALASKPSVAPVGTQSATAASTATVDVALGYTNGLSASLGSDSAAVTRLTFLMDVTNQAYANSGVAMRVRLVNAVKVTYADNTDNGDALEKLTGFKAEGGTTPIDPAFNALRAARDTSGADLVSLVRAFRTPENNGCGIAWLIGGGQTGITSADAPYGYSVVSDGTDLDEDDSNTYFCRDETLAHEMGHNMGQAHNAEDSKDEDGNQTYGLHPYSFGYREAAATGFYTVMAYPSDDKQIGIRNFANPNLKYLNRPTGVANKSDNVRSMNASMPIVATFRATVVPVTRPTKYDANRDGRTDMFFQNKSSNPRFTYWLMNGARVSKYGPVTGIATTEKPVATGDFNGDGYADVVWMNPGGRLAVWQGSSSGLPTSSVTIGTLDVGSGWTPLGAADVNGDGKSDLLFQNKGSNPRFTYWLMNGPKVSSYGPTTPIAAVERLVALDDFNGDGYADVVWINPAGRLALWVGSASKLPASYSTIGTLAVGEGWVPLGPADVNGDGKTDLMFRNTGSQPRFTYWLMNGAKVTTYGKATAIATSEKFVASGDFNADGYADIVWMNPAGRLAMWIGSKTALPASSSNFATLDVASGWQVINQVQ